MIMYLLMKILHPQITKWVVIVGNLKRNNSISKRYNVNGTAHLISSKMYIKKRKTGESSPYKTALLFAFGFRVLREKQ